MSQQLVHKQRLLRHVRRAVIKIGNVIPATDILNVALRRFGELLTQKTNGQVEVQIFPASQLGGEVDEWVSAQHRVDMRAADKLDADELPRRPPRACPPRSNPTAPLPSACS